MSTLPTDQDLVRAAHPSAEAGRKYMAAYDSGDIVYFAVNPPTLALAEVYAIEYGMRILGQVQVLSVRRAR